MMDYFFSALLGVVEGITEFLPVSSTGHLILAGKMLQLPASEFWKSFDIFIQLGAIFAVLILYGGHIMRDSKLILKIGAAFMPTAILGLVFYKLIKHYLLGNAQVVLWSLLMVGIIIILIEKWHEKKEQQTQVVESTELKFEDISYGQSVCVGLFQSLSMIPGVSRSAATIMGGLLLGIDRKKIVEFSFLLAIPTMAAASGLDLMKSSHHFSLHELGILCVGFVVSFITAFFVIKAFMRFIRKNNFILFGWYRIVIALIGFVMLLRK